MSTQYKQQIPIATIRQTIYVMIICFLPHFTTAPWWLSVLAILAVLYRLTAEYRQYPILPGWFKAIIVITITALLRWQYPSFMASGLFIGILLTFYWLKLIELHRLRDVRLIILINFYVIFAALITHISLWIFFYIILAVLANMALLIKLELPSVSVRQVGFSGLRLLGIAFPVTLLMFFLFPRLATPLWSINLPSEGHTAFSEEIRPGAFSEIALDNSTAMRITFHHKKVQPNLYWYGLALSRYDGVTWKPLPKQEDIHSPVPLLAWNKQADYEVILEPHAKRWLFYLPNPVASQPTLSFSESSGLTKPDGTPITQRFRYSLNSQTPTAQATSSFLLQQNLTLPEQANPRLKEWAIKEKLPFGNDTRAFVRHLLKYINQQPYWYKLNPKPIGTRNDQLDRFWLDTREGYCEYYASAMAFILRATGTPARIIIGYYGGEWNPVGGFLNIRQRDAHAWIEYWQPKTGWIAVDPGSAIAPSRIDNTILNEQALDMSTYSDWSKYRLTISWFTQAMLAYESARFFWEKWLLFYNQEQQQTLLRTLGMDNLKGYHLFQLWLISLLLFLLASWLYFYIKQVRQDPLEKEYTRLQKQMARLHVHTGPPATLFTQCQELAQNQPSLATLLNHTVMTYEKLRLAGHDHPENTKSVLRLFRKLRKQLETI